MMMIRTKPLKFFQANVKHSQGLSENLPDMPFTLANGFHLLF